MDNIILELSNNFNFAFVAVVNILTYLIIKVIDFLNKDKVVSILIKRIILLVSVTVVGGVYILYGQVDKVILLNSAVLAPVAWSWILKPICNKLGIDYKQIDKTIN